MKHFLSLKYFSKQELLDIIDISLKIKKDFKNNKKTLSFQDKTLGIIFNKPSTRTRVSLEVASLQLGGNTIFLSSNDLQLDRGESMEDTARVLNTMIDMVAIRAGSQKDIELFAKYSTIPVINALSDDYHPTQIIADYISIIEHKKEGGKICFIGDGNNMMNSWLYFASLLGLEISFASPKKYKIKNSFIDEAKKMPCFDETKIKFFTNPQDAIKDADVVMTDTWVSMNQDNHNLESFEGFSIDNKLMSFAKKDAIFMHCLPAYRNQEVLSEVIDSKASIVFEQSENKLHANKGIISYLNDH